MDSIVIETANPTFNVSYGSTVESWPTEPSQNFTAREQQDVFQGLFPVSSYLPSSLPPTLGFLFSTTALLWK